jgi:hypothetical protein
LAPARRFGGRGRDGVPSEGHKLAGEVVVEQREEPPTADLIQHLNLLEVTREDALSGIVGVDLVCRRAALPRDSGANDSARRSAQQGKCFCHLIAFPHPITSERANG